MTIRQFLSILINAGIFGNFSSVSSVGWMGVFWVASGIWIKINRKYDQKPAPSKTIFDATEESQSMLEKESSPKERAVPQSKSKRYALQYLLPISIPVIVTIILITPLLARASSISLSSIHSPTFRNVSSFSTDSPYASIDLDSAITSTTGLSVTSWVWRGRYESDESLGRD